VQIGPVRPFAPAAGCAAAAEAPAAVPASAVSAVPAAEAAGACAAGRTYSATDQDWKLAQLQKVARTCDVTRRRVRTRSGMR